jgi:hypothetical protein
MEPFEKDELSEAELDRILGEWNAPAAPARLRAAVFPESRTPWWRRLWTLSVPLPVACGLALLIAAGVWWWPRPGGPVVPQVVVKTERVESGFDIHGLRPVAELRPRIIRSGDAKN